jgi:hypothetical protein
VKSGRHTPRKFGVRSIAQGISMQTSKKPRVDRLSGLSSLPSLLIEALDSEAISSLFSGLDLSKPSPKVAEPSWLGFMNSFRLETERYSDELVLLSSFYDAELINLIDRIKNCELFRQVASAAYVGDNELMLWKGSALAYYLKGNDLKEFARKHDYVRKWHDDLT